MDIMEGFQKCEVNFICVVYILLHYVLKEATHLQICWMSESAMLKLKPL